MVTLKVNGQEHTLRRRSDRCRCSGSCATNSGLTGTKFGCGEGCAAPAPCIWAATPCAPAPSSVVRRRRQARSSRSRDSIPEGNHPVQRAWRETSAPQCGYCHAGQIMQAAALLAATPKPTDQDILTRMSGNICRCGCYQRIAAAVRLASTGV